MVVLPVVVLWLSPSSVSLCESTNQRLFYCTFIIIIIIFPSKVDAQLGLPSLPECQRLMLHVCLASLTHTHTHRHVNTHKDDPDNSTLTYRYN